MTDKELLELAANAVGITNDGLGHYYAEAADELQSTK